MRNSLALLTGVLLLAGCQTVRYEMHPPTSEGGRACVTQCAGIREVCRGNEIRRARSEREECEHRAEQSLRMCLASADSKERRNDCEKKKAGCWSYENEARCEDEYRICYGQCGGRVVKIVE
jgi:hypothetical protein